MKDRFFCQDGIRIKFKLDCTKYAAFYKNLLRRKSSDFLIEERRREANKIARHVFCTRNKKIHLNHINLSQCKSILSKR